MTTYFDTPEAVSEYSPFLYQPDLSDGDLEMYLLPAGTVLYHGTTVSDLKTLTTGSFLAVHPYPSYFILFEKERKPTSYIYTFRTRTDLLLARNTKWNHDLIHKFCADYSFDGTWDISPVPLPSPFFRKPPYEQWSQQTWAQLQKTSTSGIELQLCSPSTALELIDTTELDMNIVSRRVYDLTWSGKDQVGLLRYLVERFHEPEEW